MPFDSAAIAWAVIAGALIALEMITGTFYLLVFGLAAIASFLAALAGLPLVAQLLAFSAASAAGFAWLRRRKSRSKPSSLADDDLDIGAIVPIEARLPDGGFRVSLRGAPWSAIALEPIPAEAERAKVAGRDGNTLLLKPV